MIDKSSWMRRFLDSWTMPATIMMLALGYYWVGEISTTDLLLASILAHMMDTTTRGSKQ